LNHQEGDRVPIDCWAFNGTRNKIESHWGVSYEEFLDLYDVDLRYLEGPSLIQPERLSSREDMEMDLWGVPRKKVSLMLDDGTGRYLETYKEVVRSPMESLDSVESILEYDHWPSPDWYDYRSIEKQCDRIREKGRIVVYKGDRLNRLAQLKPAMYLRGSEQILVDMIMNPQIVRAIFRKISSFYMEFGARILESARGKIDILCTGDDFGSQNGMLIPLSMWSEFIEEGFQGFIRMGKSFGAMVMHHTCGSVYELIPKFIDCRLDILQSLQPEAANMDARRIKKEFGSQLCFHGGVSIQRVLPRGTPEEIRAHMAQLFDALAPGGGYIACTAHNIQVDTPIANIKALFDAYLELGKYPKR
jgi:uroporphyrinogen decarboxylase